MVRSFFHGHPWCGVVQRLAATEAVRTLELGHRSSMCTEWVELAHVVEHSFWIADSEHFSQQAPHLTFRC